MSEDYAAEMRRSAAALRAEGFNEVADGNDELAEYIEGLECGLGAERKLSERRTQERAALQAKLAAAGEPIMNNPLVILSGGQDSTTCLYWAKAMPDVQRIHAITFDYGQRHSIEIEAAGRIGQIAGVATHEFIKLPDGILRGISPLVNHDYEVELYSSAEALPGGLENTFIPARNLLFLTLAANRAYHLGCDALVVGVSQEDFGGYPDCRGSFIKSMEKTISEGFGHHIEIHTPLLDLTKRATVELAISLDGCMEAIAHSHTCYNGEAPPCGTCHACLLRERGFEEAGVPDPLITRCNAPERYDS